MMERIKLTKTEKQVLLHVKRYGEQQPKAVTPVMFHYCLSTLQEKGLVDFRANYDEILLARLTIKGSAYIEQNPKLKNPVNWRIIITMAATSKRQYISLLQWEKVKMRRLYISLQTKELILHMYGKRSRI